MSQALTLARPYARAAFSIASDDGKFADWSAALGFAAHVASDPRVAGLLGNRKLGDPDAVALLSPQGAQPLSRTFLSFLPTTAALCTSRNSCDCTKNCQPTTETRRIG